VSIPTYQGAATLLPRVQACLEAELPAVLSAASTGLSVTLDDPRSYWRGERVPADANTPGIGIWVAQSRFEEPSGLNLYDVDHEVTISLLTHSANASAADLSEYTDAVHAYADAVLYTLNRYFAADYGATVGAYKVTSLDSTPLVVEDEDRGQFYTHTQIRVAIRQRVPRWEP